MTIRLPLLFNKQHVLPSGRIPIRIAPGLQMTSLKEALKSPDGFGVCMYEERENDNRFYVIGTRVTVEDFYTNDDGSLGITVYGHECFEISSFEKNSDGVFFGECETLPQWPNAQLSENQQPLADKLQQLFDKFPDLNNMHHHKELDNLSWLCLRWLELLPVPTKEKQALINTASCSATCDYLMSLMLTPH